MGVFKQGNKYRARFARNGKTVNVGTFGTRADAEFALERARSGEVDSSKPITLKSTMTVGNAPLELHPTPPLTFWQRLKAHFKK